MIPIRLISLGLLLFSTLGFAQSGAAPSASSNLRVRVPADVLQTMIEHRTMPVYPRQAMVSGIQGEVVLAVTVDETGKVVKVEGEKGNPLLVAASANAVKSFQFRPYLQDGSAAPVESTIAFEFTLNKSGNSVDGHVECLSGGTGGKQQQPAK